jgi:hypothetical protein
LNQFSDYLGKVFGGDPLQVSNVTGGGQVFGVLCQFPNGPDGILCLLCNHGANISNPTENGKLYLSFPVWKSSPSRNLKTAASVAWRLAAIDSTRAFNRLFGPVESGNINDQKNDSAENCGVSDVESPPAIKLIAEQINVKEVDVDEVYYFPQSDAVDEIADSASRNKRQGKTDSLVGPVRVQVIAYERQDDNGYNEIVHGGTQAGPHGASPVVDQRKHQKVAEDFDGA